MALRANLDGGDVESLGRQPHLKGEGCLMIGKAYLDEKGQKGASMVDLKDKNGKTRLRMTVTDDGTASLEFLDASGKVVRTITPNQP